MTLSALLDALRPDSALWRRAMATGVAFGPDAWVRYSPPFFGVAFGAALSGPRRVVQRNLRRVLGPRPPLREAIDVAAVFSTYASSLTEAMLLASGRGYALAPRERGVEHYYAAASRGRGVIIATAHTAGWEVAGPVLRGVHPAEVIVVMRRERDARARAIQDEARERAGVRVVHIGDDPLDALPLLHHLRQGSVVAMQIDRVPPGMRCRSVRLFGEPASAPEGPLVLASLSGAPILPIFTRRLGFMEYEAVVSPAIEVPRRADDAALDRAAQAMTGAMESFLRENPTQWFHFER